jgi:hypothetical protein
MTRDPWDQLPDESDAAYCRFLVYRNLGPSRTLVRAYRAYLRGFELGQGGQKGPPGSYREEAVRFRWRERSEAWDVANLRRYGNKLAVLYVAGLEQVAAKFLRAARKYKPGDKAWPQVLDTMVQLAGQLTAAKAAGAMDVYIQPPDPGRGAAPDATRDELRPEDVA